MQHHAGQVLRSGHQGQDLRVQFTVGLGQPRIQRLEQLARFGACGGGAGLGVLDLARQRELTLHRGDGYLHSRIGRQL
jgi:hypothetical protein